MTNVTSAKNKMQIEESDYSSALSEAYFNKSGANINYLHDHVDSLETQVAVNTPAVISNTTNINGLANYRNAVNTTTINFAADETQYLYYTIPESTANGGITFNVTTNSEQFLIIRSERPLRMVQLRNNGGVWGPETTMEYSLVPLIRSVDNAGNYNTIHGGPAYYIEYIVDFRLYPNVVNYIHLEVDPASTGTNQPGDERTYHSFDPIITIRSSKRLTEASNLGQ